MEFIEMDDLENKINKLKRELVQTARVTGLNSYDTLYCSQKLDELITIYQKYSLECSTIGRFN